MTISDDDFASDNDFIESDAESDYAPDEEEEESPRKKVLDPLFYLHRSLIACSF